MRTLLKVFHKKKIQKPVSVISDKGYGIRIPGRGLTAESTDRFEGKRVNGLMGKRVYESNDCYADASSLHNSNGLTVKPSHKHIYPSTHIPNSLTVKPITYHVSLITHNSRSITVQPLIPYPLSLITLLLLFYAQAAYCSIPISTSRVYDDSGKLFSDVTYEENGIAVVRNYFKSGQVMQEIKYNQRQQIRHIRYYPDGKVAFLSQATGGSDSVFTLYYPNGAIKTTGPSVNYELHGDYKEYFPDGDLSHVMRYRHNRLVDDKEKPVTGTLEYFYKDGRLMETVTSRDGMPEGANRIYHPDGYLMAEVVYENNAIISDKIFDREGNVLYEHTRKK